MHTSADAFAPIVLASGSPRRMLLLAEAGFVAEIEAADLDDVMLTMGEVDALAVAPALAHFKAQRVATRRKQRGARAAWILAADTVCERDGVVLGKPADQDEARAMIESLSARGHRVITGWCLLGPNGARHIGRDIARVEIGVLPPADFESFLEGGCWRGKAGGYNLTEVIARGWPVRCEGDPQTVVGLPIQRLAPFLRRAMGASA